MTNRFRGEYQFEIGELSLPLKASFQNVARIEPLLGIGLFDLVQQLAAANYRLDWAAQILWCLSHDEKGIPPKSVEEIGEALMDNMHLMIPALDVSVLLISGQDPDNPNLGNDTAQTTSSEEKKVSTSPSRKPSSKRKPT